MTDDDILDRLLDPDYNFETTKTEEKLFVCYEVPSGATVKKYAVEEKKLTIVIIKHPLMFSAKAIHIAGMHTGAITDLPESRRGVLRETGWNQALESFASKFYSGENAFSLERTIEIELEDEVNPESTIHFTYCFKPTKKNPFQCSFAYFEFDVGPKPVHDDDNFTKSGQVFFHGDGGNGSSGSSGGGQGDDSSNNNTSNQHANNHQQNHKNSSVGGRGPNACRRMNPTSTNSSTSYSHSNFSHIAPPVVNGKFSSIGGRSTSPNPLPVLTKKKKNILSGTSDNDCDKENEEKEVDEDVRMEEEEDEEEQDLKDKLEQFYCDKFNKEKLMLEEELARERSRIESEFQSILQSKEERLQKDLEKRWDEEWNSAKERWWESVNQDYQQSMKTVRIELQEVKDDNDRLASELAASLKAKKMKSGNKTGDSGAVVLLAAANKENKKEKQFTSSLLDDTPSKRKRADDQGEAFSLRHNPALVVPATLTDVSADSSFETIGSSSATSTTREDQEEDNRTTPTKTSTSTSHSTTSAVTRTAAADIFNQAFTTVASVVAKQISSAVGDHGAGSTNKDNNNNENTRPPALVLPALPPSGTTAVEEYDDEEMELMRIL